MRLTLFPTSQVLEVRHPCDQTTVSARVWAGVDDEGTEVTALIVAVAPLSAPPDMGEWERYRDRVREAAGDTPGLREVGRSPVTLNLEV